MSKASARWGAVTMAGIAAVAAVLSYFDGLFVVRLAGNGDWRAFLYPLLPDGLIVICLIALLGAGKRPRWATCGLVLGIGLTLAMNVGAGVAHSPLDAVVDGFVPVVFFVAVEVFIGYVRRGRGSHPPTPAPATVPACPHVVGDPADAIRVAVEHARECLDQEVTIRGLSRQMGIDHRKVSTLARPVAGPPGGERQPPPDRGPDGAVPPQPAPAVRATLNGAAHG